MCLGDFLRSSERRDPEGDDDRNKRGDAPAGKEGANQAIAGPRPRGPPEAREADQNDGHADCEQECFPD